jgi:hypothetical protein
VKSSTKTCTIEFLSTCYNGFYYAKNEQSTMSLSIILNMFGRLFWFATGMCSYSFCRTFDGTSLKIKIKYSTTFSSSDICKTKNSSKPVQYDGKWHSCRLFNLNIRKPLEQVKRNVTFSSNTFFTLQTVCKPQYKYIKRCSALWAFSLYITD